MIKYVRADKKGGKEPVLFQTVIEKGSELKDKPTLITFTMLTAPDNDTTNLMTGHGAPVDFGTEKCVVRAIALQTCASVCFISRKQPDNPKGYVFHANSGNVTEEKFKEIMKKIDAGEAPYEKVDVIYAHRGATDDEYTKNLALLDKWLNGGVIVEVTELPATDSFGLDQSVHAGL